MKVTFPHMGNMNIPIRVMFDTIGIEYVMPPLPNKKTLESGSIYSPEFVCLPFKIILGDFITGIGNGADTVIMGGGCGQCRLSYYGDLQDEILKSVGYKNNFICINVANMNFKGMMEKISPLTKEKSKFNIIRGIVYALRTVFIIDKLNRLANYIRCREMKKGETDSILNRFYNDAQKTKGYRELCKIVRLVRIKLKKVQIDRKVKPLKIAIVGEIYTAIEPFVNMNIEKMLGNMGVEVHNTQSISCWIMNHFIKNLFPIKFKDKAHEVGKEFIKTDDIGGHGLETIGNIILSAKNKFDGAIHLYPLTCMPEIIAQSTFNELQNKYEIPIITLILDEMNGEAGYITRIEAFIDMLERRKLYKEGYKPLEA